MENCVKNPLLFASFLLPCHGLKRNEYMGHEKSLVAMRKRRRRRRLCPHVLAISHIYTCTKWHLSNNDWVCKSFQSKKKLRKSSSKINQEIYSPLSFMEKVGRRAEEEEKKSVAASLEEEKSGSFFFFFFTKFSHLILSSPVIFFLSSPGGPALPDRPSIFLTAVWTNISSELKHTLKSETY